MKKITSILAVMTCVFALTACSSTTSTIEGDAMAAEEQSAWIASGEQLVDYIQEIQAAGQADELSDDAVWKAAMQSWENAMTDIGEVVGYQNEYAVYSDKNEVSINIGIDGSDHDANVVIVASQDNTGVTTTGITTNVVYSFAELMQQAALNTVLGMGTTFIVLILLAFLISLFRYIPALLDKSSKEEEVPVAPAPKAAAAAPAAKDDEILAVISAAVAAYEQGV